MTDQCGIYVASRASIPARGIMWRQFRSEGWPIISSWIDEDGEGETSSFADLWRRIELEITASCGLILYAELTDLPLKGALIEVGMAIAAGKPVFVVLPTIELEPRSMRPVGSWLAHPAVHITNDVLSALRLLASPQPSRTKGED